MVDELTPIAEYMAGEMNANTKSTTTLKIKGLLQFSGADCYREIRTAPYWQQMFMSPEVCYNTEMNNYFSALMLWAGKVQGGGDWDHKPKIMRKFPPRDPTQKGWYLYGSTLYYYDVWSNVHYGYVGRAAGFTDDVLLDGAGLAQVISDLIKMKAFSYNASVSGFGRFDPPEDRASIKIGMALYASNPSQITAKTLLSAILQSKEISQMPYLDPLSKSFVPPPAMNLSPNINDLFNIR